VTRRTVTPVTAGNRDRTKIQEQLLQLIQLHGLPVILLLVEQQQLMRTLNPCWPAGGCDTVLLQLERQPSMVKVKKMAAENLLNSAFTKVQQQPVLPGSVPGPRPRPKLYIHQGAALTVPAGTRDPY
jgi:hypothetical protein